MTEREFSELIEEGVVYLDGATGTNLFRAGMPEGVCPEQWILENPQILIELQRQYAEAGSRILYAPTFTCNRIKLSEYGLEDRIGDMNRRLVGLSKEAASGRASVFVAGDITMTGRQLAPLGTLAFEELVDIYKEQIRYIAEAGADLLVVETMMSLQETRAAVIAAKEVCSLPVMATLSFEENGRTLFGTDAATAALVLEGLGVCAVGVNCSTGPDRMVSVISEMRRVVSIPIIAKPNAGLPELDEHGETFYGMSPEIFAQHMETLVAAGADIVGGCCGTTPEYIAELKKYFTEKDIKPKRTSENGKKGQYYICSERHTLEFERDGRFIVIGERINPTGKKWLQEEIRGGSFEGILRMADEQAANGADILDVNLGMSGIDEKEVMLKAISELTQAVSLPLCIDSSHIDVVEAALRIYPGRALINSISLEKDKADRLMPLVRKYGAMFVLLPLSDKGLPESLEEKHGIIRELVRKARQYGLSWKDIIVDGLVTTVGADSQAAVRTLETIRYCKEELGLPTVVGLSNISFGLPDRITVNTAFLTMAIRAGLTMAIANPMQEQLMKAAYATELLLGRNGADVRYIEAVGRMEANAANHIAAVPPEKQNKPQPLQKNAQDTSLNVQRPEIYTDVIKGNRAAVTAHVKQAVAAGITADEILNTMLIPAINEVGALFEKQIYFLPQLINSAETMKLAVEYIEPVLAGKGDNESRVTVVIATVQGDIHDIGKNLVVLMMKNYGYRVIDLGKDVSRELIVETAIKENADIIGLSALMTTTMLEMKRVIQYAHERGCRAKIIIGGAVITEDFALEIGADGYSRDAADAVKLVERLLQKK